MTSKEKQLIKACRVILYATDDFTNHIKEELGQIGFEKILSGEAEKCVVGDRAQSIIIEYIGDGSSLSAGDSNFPVIYSFDFIYGAGAIVMFPGDDRSWVEKQGMRKWVAEYISGYCAFWNVDGCDWLYEALPSITENRTSEAALNTAACMCAKIAANIAVGREVKRYPRFYLCRNSE